MKKSDVTFEKTFQGAWKLSAIVDGYLVIRSYFDYTKSEAWGEFLAEYRKGFAK